MPAVFVHGNPDLVGHDLGGGHVLDVVLSRADLVRSWVSDVPGIYEPDYVWHEWVRRWQTRGAGEADVAQRFGGTVETRTAGLIERGMGDDVAFDRRPSEPSEEHQR